MMPQELFRYAKQLAQDPAFGAALEALTGDAVNMFKGSAPEDKETREQAYHMQMAVDKIRSHIQNWAKLADR